MLHPSDEQLLALLDDALAPAPRAEVSAHVEGCADCRRSLEILRQAMAAVHVEATLVDATEPASWRQAVPPPRWRDAPWAASERDGTLAGESTLPRPRSVPQRPVGSARPVGRVERPRWRWGTSALRWAAALLVVAGGAGAMVATRWWVAERANAPVDSAVAAAPLRQAQPALTPAPVAAVTVSPRDGRALVILTGGTSLVNAAGGDASAIGTLIVRTTDRADVQVTVATALAAGAVPRFRSADGRLEVTLPVGGARVEVEFPAALGAGQVTLDGEVVAEVVGGVVTPSAATTTGVTLTRR